MAMVPAVLSAVLIGGFAVLMIHVTASANANDGWYAVSLTRLPNLIVAKYPNAVAALVLAYLLWASHRFWSWAISGQIRARVRLVACMLHHSDVALLIADPLYRMEPETQGLRKLVAAPRRIRSFDATIRKAADTIELLWEKACKDHRAIRRIDLQAGSLREASWLGAGCTMFAIVMLLFTLLPGAVMLIPFTALMVWHATAGAALIRKRASLVAVCDFLLENYDPEHYQGWKMPV